MGSRRQLLSALAGGVAAPLVLERLGRAAGAPEGSARWRAPPGGRGIPVTDPTRFGAVGDGVTPAGRAIQRAVDACADGGGGVVSLPPGRYLSGAIFLRSNVHLHIAAGAALVASETFDDFPPIKGRWEGIERTTHASLLTGIELENVTITGQGSIEGQGAIWWRANDVVKKVREQAGLRREDDNPKAAPLRWPRPRLINLIRCQRVNIADLLLGDAPSYFIHFVYCQNVNIENVSVVAFTTSNGDGIVVDSSKDVRIADCSIGSGSDCIGIKAGYNEDGRRVGIPTEDVIITNCHLSNSAGAAVAIGSETSGGIRNVTISNCTIANTTDGLYIKSARGRGGVIEGIRASNLVMSHLRRAALMVSMYFNSVSNSNSITPRVQRPENDRALLAPVDEGTPTLREIDVDGLTALHVRDLVVVEGLRERYVQGLRLERLAARGATTGVTLTCAADVAVSALAITAPHGPAVKARDVQTLEIHRLKCLEPSPRRPVIELTNVTRALVHGCQVDPGAPSFLVADHCREVTMVANEVPPERAGSPTPPPAPAGAPVAPVAPAAGSARKPAKGPSRSQR
jgi:polygalacturonase